MEKIIQNKNYLLRILHLGKYFVDNIQREVLEERKLVTFTELIYTPSKC